MEYYITDLLSILMDLESNFERLYKNISIIEGQYDLQLRTAAKVLSSEEGRHAAWYKQLILDITQEGNFTIETEMYDNAKSILNEFKKGIQIKSFGDIREFISFAVSYEKLNATVLIGILEQLTEADKPKISGLLNQLILIEAEHSATLLRFLPGGIINSTENT